MKKLWLTEQRRLNALNKALNFNHTTKMSNVADFLGINAKVLYNCSDELFKAILNDINADNDRYKGKL